SACEFTLSQILRREWGFRGFVVSDWTSIGELIPHGVANDLATAAAKAFLAGVDMDMGSNAYLPHLPDLVRAGTVPEAAVDCAVRRMLRVKFALGLFEDPYTPEPGSAGGPIAHAFVLAAREAAEQTFVLLKNEPVESGSPLLPLGRGLKTLALI